MRNLDEILMLKQEIMKWAEEFGFKSEIRLYHDKTTLNKLSFIVFTDLKEASSYNEAKNYLTVKLRDLLKCDLVIFNYKSVNTPWELNKNSVLITANLSEFEQLFRKKYSEIYFDCYQCDEDDRLTLAQSEKYLKNKNNPPCISSDEPKIAVIDHHLVVAIPLSSTVEEYITDNNNEDILNNYVEEFADKVQHFQDKPYEFYR